MRSTTRKKRLVSAIRNAVKKSALAGPHGETYGEFLRSLPVAPNHETKKQALIKELRDVEKQHHALLRRVRKAVDRLDRLPVVRMLIR
jgi:ribosome recycling factor